VRGRLVRDYMTTDPVTLLETDALRAAVELVLVRRVRHAPVVREDGSLVGIVTDRDVKRMLPSPLEAPDSEEYERLLDETPVVRVMTREPVAIQGAMTVAEAVRLMLQRRIGGMPVLADGRLVGIFTETDALRGYLELLEGPAAGA
jgi:acetoin utilization protein AcuB